MADLGDMLALTESDQRELDSLRKKQGPIPNASQMSAQDQAELEALRSKQGPISLAPEGTAESAPQEQPGNIDPAKLMAARTKISAFGPNPLVGAEQLSKDLGVPVQYAPAPKENIIESPEGTPLTERIGNGIQNLITKLSTAGRGGYVFPKEGHPGQYNGVLDPNMFAQLANGDVGGAVKDLPKDVLDILPDAAKQSLALAIGSPAGVATTAALSGASPFISVPAGMAATAFASGAADVPIDLAKQFVGKYFFPKQEVSVPRALESGATTALTTPLAGGVAPKSMIEGTAKNLESKAIQDAIDSFSPSAKSIPPATAAEFENLLNKSQAGIIPELGKKLYSWASGTPEKVMQDYTRFQDKITPYEQGQKIPAMQRILSDVKNKFYTNKSVIGSDLNVAANQSNLKIPNTNAENEFRDLLTEINAKEASGELAAGEGTDLADAKKTIEEILQSKFQRELPGEPATPHSKIVDEFGNPAIPGQPEILPGSERIPRTMSVSSAIELQAQLKPLMDLQERRLALNPNRAPTAGATSFDSRIEKAANAAYHDLNNNMDQAIASVPKEQRPAIQELRQKYAALSELERDVKNKFQTPESVEKSLFAAENDPHGIPRERLQQIDQALGTKLVDEADALKAHESIGELPRGNPPRKINPSPVSTLGATVGGAAGFGLGNAIGGKGSQLPWILMGAGSGLGAVGTRKVINPDVTRMLLNMSNSIPGRAIRTGATVANPSIWELLANEYNKPNTQEILNQRGK